MKAMEIREHFEKVGTWVDWSDTVDHFLFGDPQTEVQGIATAWVPTNKAIRLAHEKGLNLFITHEPAFAKAYAGMPGGESFTQAKRQLLDEFGMVLLRCHDTWDRMPDYGIPDTWASWLGFETEARPVESFYKTCLVPSLTLEETAAAILEKVRTLGQDNVRFLGDKDRVITRLVIGTGAITKLPYMMELGADALLATDDGTRSWIGGLWSLDLDIPLLIVNHATAEKPGMMAMADYLSQQYPGIPAQYIDIDLPFKTVHL